MARSAWMAFLLVAGTFACSADPPAPVPEEGKAVAVAAPLQGNTVAHAVPWSPWRFDVPARPVRVESARMDPQAPAHKVKERFQVKNEGRLLVRVDVWVNPAGLALDAWVDSHASTLKLGEVEIGERPVGKSGVRALVFDQARSCQARNIVTAVFALEGHVIAVTCADGEDAAARGAFDVVLSSFAGRSTP